MTWWLWLNVGHGDKEQKLSYGEISGITGISRSSVQAGIEAFDKKLEKGLDRHLLERLMHTGARLGLGYNMVYKHFANKGLVPPRERPIDSFDELDKLI